MSTAPKKKRRFVLIQKHGVAVYKERKQIAVFEIDPDVPLTPEIIEQVRTANHEPMKEENTFPVVVEEPVKKQLNLDLSVPLLLEQDLPEPA